MAMQTYSPEGPPDLFETDIRTLAHVERWGIGRMLRRQSVAEHSYFVVVYAVQIADLLQWTGDYGALLMWAVAHDMEELFTGDIMGLFKRAALDEERSAAFITQEAERRFGSFVGDQILDDLDNRIPGDIKKIVKAADMVDETIRLYEEQALGNQTMNEVLVQNVLPRLQAAWMALPGDRDLISQLFHSKVLPRVQAHATEPVRPFPNVAP